MIGAPNYQTKTYLSVSQVYGKTRPNSCQVNVRNSMEFSLYIGYNDVDCDVRQEIPGRFASDIVIQHHDMIVTGADVGLKVNQSGFLSEN